MKMLKKPGRILVAFIALAMSMLGMSLAEASGTTGSLPITSILVFSGGGMFLYTNGNWPNPDNCANPVRLSFNSSAGNYNMMMTMLYDAYANGDTVNFTLSGCDTNGSQSNPHVTSFTLQKN